MASISKYVGKKGEVSYRFRISAGYDDAGKQIVRTKTWRPPKTMTSKQAEREAVVQAALFEQQLTQQVCADRQRMKFDALADEWLELMETTGGLKRSTLVLFRGCRDRTFAALGNKYLDEITHRDIQKFILTLGTDGGNLTTGGALSTKRQSQFLTFISDVFRYAMKCGLVSANPSIGVSTVRQEKHERLPYTVEEEIALMTRLAEKAPLKYQLMFAFFMYCGMRRGEVLGLEWKDIDLDTGVCCIQRTSQYKGPQYGIYTTTPKTKSSIRQLKLPDEVMALLRRYKLEQNSAKVVLGSQWHDSDRIFASWNGQPINPDGPYSWLYRFCKSEGLPFRGLHSFRHAFATAMIVNGQIDVKTVSSILGHSEISTTLNIYTHAIHSANAQAMDFVADVLRGGQNNDKNKDNGQKIAPQKA
ncbi:MAG: site-specific integrase [Clostridia bacterium]|nr:site-specific integrase [Clostridia bacterium]